MANDAAPAGPPPANEGDAASLPPGVTLADYVIQRPLGGGGFGITYLARDSNLQLPVAIKEYFPSELVTRGPDNVVRVRSSNPEHQEQYDWGLERFLDEARALATFRHPNIVRVLRYFRDNGTAYIVMEYESGLPLKRWVPQNMPLSQKALLSIIYPLLDGLESVHNTGFLHRDIKPDNIYVRADGTPVLLDFGAARRVSANKDLTNIVSPGFAPFEQYHSQGNQGPWTDIYSIGAVMYWMTTGRKPVESAARVKQDTMLPASGLADAGVFGESLLQAIDWALQPDEGKRPQNVTILRASIQGSEKVDGKTVDIEVQADRPAVSSPPSQQRRNLVCTIMFLDLVGYSKRSVEDQVALKKLFSEVLAKAVKGVPDDARIAIDTGDGAAICFLGDPEEALNSAMLLRDLLGQRRALTLRTGLHMGPVRVINDINARVNVIGDGINVAQRIMDFAQPNQVLVSRSYYDVISRITDDTAELFQYMGQYEDKHGRLHEVYSVGHQRSGATQATTRREGPSTGYTRTQPAPSGQPLLAEDVHDVEMELVRHIGPLAKVLVRKAVPLAPTIPALREALAPTIQEQKAREAFIAGASSQSHPDSQPVSSKRATTKPPTSQRTSSPSQFGGLGPSIPVVARGSTKSVPFGTAPSKNLSIPTSPSKLAPHPQLELDGEEAAAIERALSKYIGPMAKMIIRKEASRNANFGEFLTAVAGNIDQPTQRDQFLAALKRSLVRRY
ncbi:protein kinase domain-containing protein [Ramlibacter sp. PS4R-6]|uniref:protein kinase domain-containing protein n=1 Tax=Ramlibacter sp. PS4R-6 TaxID=3133438 RepID=UPI0030AB04A1